ncbi:MAG: protein kinase [Myxococcales bacterium]|nr:protein kinase [Myxococcales bacterium]
MADGAVQYRFLAVVGEGGFGKVYRARLETDEGFNKDVAIKVLSDPDPPESLLERFRDEAKILGLVRDRAVVGVEPPIRIGEKWAVVMEFVDGVSCGQMLDIGPIPPGVAVEVVGEVARALHAAYHQEGPEGEPLQLLHRDIKPENIQVTPSGDVRLLDFGIARANFAAREFKTRHSLGGTPGYIAPERLQRVEVAEGDVYSLGVVLHEMLTCERPKYPPTIEFSQPGARDGATIDGIVVDTADLEVDDALRGDPHAMQVLKLAAWMRAYEPENRPSAREVEEACRELRRTLPGPYFRNWAEEFVPHRNEIEGDQMIGQVITTTIGLTGEIVGRRGANDGTTGSLPPGSGRQGVALGAMLGGSLVLFLAGAAVVLFALGLGVAWYLNQPDEVLVQTDAKGPDEGPAAVVVEPGDPPVAVNPDPDLPVLEGVPSAKPPSAPVASPASQPGTAPIRVIVAPQPSGVSVTKPGPEPVPGSRVGPKMGTVVVKSVPSGATVWKSGKQLSKVGSGYELPVGRHTIELRSPAGEKYPIPLQIKAGKRIHICYDFDAKQTCDSR